MHKIQYAIYKIYVLLETRSGQTDRQTDQPTDQPTGRRTLSRIELLSQLKTARMM